MRDVPTRQDLTTSPAVTRDKRRNNNILDLFVTRDPRYGRNSTVPFKRGARGRNQDSYIVYSDF